MKHKFVTIFDPKTSINFASKFNMAMIIAVVLPIVTLIGLFNLWHQLRNRFFWRDRAAGKIF
jgi:hypothetical protein